MRPQGQDVDLRGCNICGGTGIDRKSIYTARAETGRAACAGFTTQPDVQMEMTSGVVNQVKFGSNLEFIPNFGTWHQKTHKIVGQLNPAILSRA